MITMNESYRLVDLYSRRLLLLPHNRDGVAPEAEHDLNAITIFARCKDNLGVLFCLHSKLHIDIILVVCLLLPAIVTFCSLSCYFI